MKAWLRSHWQYLVNVILFLVFLDIAVHQVVLKVVPFDEPLHEWYWTSVAAADSSFPWYSIYSNGQWLESADWSKMTLADWAFAAQTMLMISLVLLRRKHAAINRNPWQQFYFGKYQNGCFYYAQGGSGSSGQRYNHGFYGHLFALLNSESPVPTYFFTYDSRNRFVFNRKEKSLWLNFFDLVGNFKIDRKESERILENVNRI